MSKMTRLSTVNQNFAPTGNSSCSEVVVSAVNTAVAAACAVVSEPMSLWLDLARDENDSRVIEDAATTLPDSGPGSASRGTVTVSVVAAIV